MTRNTYRPASAVALALFALSALLVPDPASAENIVTYDQDIAAWVADFGEEGGPPG